MLREPVEQALAGAARRPASPASSIELPAAAAPFDDGAARALQAAVAATASLDGYLYLPADALDASRREYHGKNVSNVMDLRPRGAGGGGRPHRASPHRRRAARRRACKAVTRRLDLKTMRLSAAGEREDRGAGFFLSIILLMILYTDRRHVGRRH